MPLVVPIVMMALSLPAIAGAQDDAIARARAAIREGEHERAIAILERAREQDTAPEIDLELSIAHEALGHDEQAAEHLAIYLDAEGDLDPDERDELARHLRDLRVPRSRPARGDPTLEIAGWAQLAAGIVGLAVFAGAGGVAYALENGLDEDCRREERLCPPGERAPIRDAWTVSTIGLGAGLVFALLGAIELALSGAGQPGASRSLPPDLDPSVQRTFTLAPWIGGDGAGVGARLAF